MSPAQRVRAGAPLSGVAIPPEVRDRLLRAAKPKETASPVTDKGACPHCGWQLLAPAKEGGEKIQGERVVLIRRGTSQVHCICKCRQMVNLNPG